MKLVRNLIKEIITSFKSLLENIGSLLKINIKYCQFYQKEIIRNII